jgi:dihydroxyacetone kinase-like predicted kinase
VIPSKTVPQGLSALLAFNPGADIVTNKKTMTDAFEHVKTGQITFAVRDTTIDGLAIEKDDFMGILDGKILFKNKDKQKTASELLTKMIDDDSEIVTILKGEDATDEDVAALVSFIEDQYEDMEIEVHNGNQPLYPFIISVE